MTGAHFGFEADSFLTEEGEQPRVGHVFLVIDPGALVGQGAYLDRVDALVDAMLADEGVRLPGARRDGLGEQAASKGITVPDALLQQLHDLAGTAQRTG
ncbi:Malate/L-lactate dehydrogenases [Mycobacteroides abscessus subsp. abscessus]|nr:Malate/L-lactate dehydrogenases [Mycobacteroides abscessus subsp. abscessus]